MKKYTAKEAAAKVGVSYSRIRQLCASGEIDFEYFGNVLMITEEGIRQAKNRNTKPGPVSQKNVKEAA